MEYKYLKQWVKENENLNLLFQNIKKFEDQYQISFKKSNRKLQINLSSNPTIFFTKEKYLPFEEKSELQNWNVLLAKSKLDSIHIINNDRILDLVFLKVDIYNEKIEYHIILELVPNYQNIIITIREKENYKILDSLKKISFMENNQRQILPGIYYQFPHTSYKISDELVNYPLSIDEKGKIIFSQSGVDSINEVFETLYYNYQLQKKTEQIASQKEKRLATELKKKEKKLIKLESELNISSNFQEWLQKAELLKSNQHLINPGMNKIKLVNYYSENLEEIEISLKEELSPRENIEFYFKKYRKGKSGMEKIKEQISKTKNEIDILKIKIDELVFINDYLDALQLIKEDNKKKLKENENKFKHIKIDDNWEIYIGRTSTENDFLTTRFAKPHDWWFHTRIFRGTHIILRNYHKLDLPDDLLHICVGLAAYFSKAKNSSNVPVDYTQIRYVRKPKGSVPGYVVYKNQKTVYAEPISMRDAVLQLEKR